MNRRGSSLLEVVVSLGVFFVFTGTLFFIFDVGSRAFRDSNSGSEARYAAALIIDRLGRLSNQSSKKGVATSAAIVAFLLPLDADGHLVYDQSGHPIWQRYRLFFRDVTTNEFRETDRPVGPLEGTAVPLNAMDFGLGPKPLSSYATGGQVVARGITKFEPVWEKAGTLTVHLVAEIEQRRGRPPARCELSTRLAVRN